MALLMKRLGSTRIERKRGGRKREELEVRVGEERVSRGRGRRGVRRNLRSSIRMHQ
jgi:hypothetical protein